MQWAQDALVAELRGALQRIEVAHPALGRHLADSVRTGTYCVYQPTHLWTGPPGSRRTLCDAISRLMGEPPAKENPMAKISLQTPSPDKTAYPSAKASPSRPRRPNSRSPAAEVTLMERADLPAHIVALDLAATRWASTPAHRRPPRPLLVAERMSTTLNNPPPKGPTR